ncbi:MAG TPA: protease pro-enzyme activation domain-containing protein [Bryobacteraceae bacterium]|nr:protease pro-enzyme activation domain-containing protein [Bryobacteraceae bacterium]
MAYLPQVPKLSAAQLSRISGPVDNTKRVFLKGHIHPSAVPENDQGRVEASLTLPYITVMLRPSAAQQADLEQLLAQQQDPSSPNYHKWLTPEQYADRFGVSQSDLDQLTTWLQQQNLTIAGVARARNWVAVSGGARDVESAFGIELHHYMVNGELHYANSGEPSVPAAFNAVVSEIHGLSDFRLRPAARTPHQIVNPLHPNYNSSGGSHYLAPDDVATIYNIQPLYNAGIDGTGQKIAVVGQTKVNLSDIQSFRSYFSLAANDPQFVLVANATDPGVVKGDLAEADLDIELAGAVARNATIIYVYSGDVETSAQYAVDQNIAPVLSMSYGLCEALTPLSDARSQQALAQQANAQGITWVAASGDNGAADCYGSSTRTSYGLSVDLPGAIPEVTSIGGTEFNENGGSYWNSTNSATRSSALSYIPEAVWNDTAIDGSPSASGGGASVFFTKPTWQTGLGVPSDGARDVPDISLSGSADHDAYMFYTGGSLGGVGGTSVGAPSFSGMIALLNHYLVTKGVQASAGMGNVNPRLYSLAQATPGAFHDITSGDNMVDPCPSRARNCTPTPVGFSAGTGYDLATGLGSVDAFAMVTAWGGGGTVSARRAPNLTVSSNSHTITSADSVVVTATISGGNGVTPTGTVTFLAGNTTLGSSILSGSSGTAIATLSVSGAQLAVGSDTITAQYSGDSNFNSASSTVSVTVSAIASSGPPSISGLTNGASFQKTYAPGMVMTVFGSQLSPVTASAANVPLPTQLGGVQATVNGISAPLYYVSPGQLNIQVPYEATVNGNATLVVSNNGQTTSTTFRVAAAAPGIFVNTANAPVPNTTAARGQTVTLFVTGVGLVSPVVSTGAAPASGTPVASLPAPNQSVSLTVGGVNTPISFSGIPAGLVGVLQINYTVPSQLATGAQPVVVTVGGAASQSVTLTVTP